MYDVTAVGELLIDFTPAGLSGQGQPLFEQNPGGAPANVLAALSRLGRRTAFVGKVGQDFFGDYLAGVLAQAHIACDGLLRDPSCRTTLAFVHLDPNGDRSFSFYRNPGADLMLRPGDPGSNHPGLPHFHFGSVSMTGDPRAGPPGTRRAGPSSRPPGSYDPNLRLPLWSSPRKPAISWPCWPGSTCSRFLKKN
jgi:sugar/nucleoside kinase (ribokinase family)